MRFRFEQRVEAPRERLFEFHCDPANLSELLEGWKGFELLEHEGHIRPGARVRVRQAFGPRVHEMTFEQFLLEPPERFGERQIEGPFEHLEHVHELLEDDGATLLVDRLDLALPWRLGGAIAERTLMAPALERFFEFRGAAYERLCAAGRFT